MRVVVVLRRVPMRSLPMVIAGALVGVAVSVFGVGRHGALLSRS
jgi:hypothetical protein